MIRLGVSAETDREVGRRLMSIGNEVARLFNSAQAGSDSDYAVFEIRYVPIVMANGGSGRYPARTKCYPDESVLDLCPVLDHDALLVGTSDEAVWEYCRGLKLARELLPGERRTEFDLRIKNVEKELGVLE